MFDLPYGLLGICMCLGFYLTRMEASWALGLGHRGGRKEEGKGKGKAERSDDDMSTYMSCPMLDVSWSI